MEGLKERRQRSTQAAQQIGQQNQTVNEIQSGRPFTVEEELTFQRERMLDENEKLRQEIAMLEKELLGLYRRLS